MHALRSPDVRSAMLSCMSDLQCPATFVLLTPASLKSLDARGLRLAGVFVDANTHARTRLALDTLLAAHGCKLELAKLDASLPLVQQIEQLSDAYRGETLLLLAPESALCEALGCDDPPTRPVTVEVDSDGWNVL